MLNLILLSRLFVSTVETPIVFSVILKSLSVLRREWFPSVFIDGDYYRLSLASENYWLDMALVEHLFFRYLPTMFKLKLWLRLNFRFSTYWDLKSLALEVFILSVCGSLFICFQVSWPKA